MRKLISAALLLCVLASVAVAQTSPNIQNGQVPTAAQWNSYFQAKQDALGYVPLNRAGGTMIGRLVVAGVGTTAGFNIVPGTAPGLPVNGDVWVTPSGIFARVNGATVSLIGGTVTSVGLSVPPVFTVSGSPVTSGGTIAVDLANQSANTVWAGPTSGGAAKPTFRGLVAADIPTSLGLTGVPTAPTPSFGDASTKVATTAFIGSALANSIGLKVVTGLTSDLVQTTTTVNVAASSTAMTVAGGIAPCVAGNSIVVAGAGANSSGDVAPLVTTISAVSGASVTLSAPAVTTVSGSSTVSCGTDNTSALQTAITNNADVWVPKGSYLVAGDISFGSGHTIRIPRGAKIVSAGRFTSIANGLTDVHYVVDGALLSLGMQDITTPLVTGYPPAEAGFIQMGGFNTAQGATGKNISVTGTGSICGPFSGTPNLSNVFWQIKRKGVATWFASDVLYSDIEICNFHGEAGYYYTERQTDNGVRITHVWSHDNRFNGLNFNISGMPSGSVRGFMMDHNTISNAFTCIEASAGQISDNKCDTYQYAGVLGGGGNGYGPIHVIGNTVYAGGVVTLPSTPVCGDPARSAVAYCIVFGNAPDYQRPSDVVVQNNIAVFPGDSCFLVQSISSGQFSNNYCRGWGNGTNAYAYDFGGATSDSAVASMRGDGNTATGPGANSLGTFHNAGNTSGMNIGPTDLPSVGSIQVTNQTPPNAWLAPGGTAGTPLLNNVGAAPTYGALNLAAAGVISGILPAANGGAGTVNGALKGNGAGSVSQAACADLSNGGSGGCALTYTFGPWTPAFTTDGTVGTPAYAANGQVGSYEHVGDEWRVRFRLTLSGWTGSPTGNVLISNLPHANNATTNDWGECFITAWSSGVALVFVSGVIKESASSITLFSTTAAATGPGALTQAQLSSTGNITGSCTYHE